MPNGDPRWAPVDSGSVGSSSASLFLCLNLQAELELKKAYIVHLWAIARKFQLTYEHSILAAVVPDCIRTSRMLRAHLAHVSVEKEISAEKADPKTPANTAREALHSDLGQSLFQARKDALLYTAHERTNEA